MKKLTGLLKLADDHGFFAQIINNSVVINITWNNTKTNTNGIEKISCNTRAEMRAALGY